MLTVEQFQAAKFKRTNISVNAELTKQRVDDLFRHAKIKQKQEVRSLADISTQTVSNVYRNGSISIKMAIALSQVLDVNPFYLTGEADERGVFSEEAIRDLLLKHKYRDLASSLKLPEREKRPYKRREQPAEPGPVEVAKAVEPAFSPDLSMIEAADAQVLLRAWAVRAKAGIAGAQERLDKVRQLLLAGKPA
jgi:transcriptional regulator with XRE-family HTH domain